MKNHFVILLFLIILLCFSSCLFEKNIKDNNIVPMVIGEINGKTYKTIGYSWVYYNKNSKNLQIHVSNSQDDYTSGLNTWFIIINNPRQNKIIELDGSAPPEIGVIYEDRSETDNKFFYTNLNNLKIELNKCELYENGIVSGTFEGKMFERKKNIHNKNDLFVKGRFLSKIKNIDENQYEKKY